MAAVAAMASRGTSPGGEQGHGPALVGGQGRALLLHAAVGQRVENRLGAERTERGRCGARSSVRRRGSWRRPWRKPRRRPGRCCPPAPAAPRWETRGGDPGCGSGRGALGSAAIGTRPPSARLAGRSDKPSKGERHVWGAHHTAKRASSHPFGLPTPRWPRNIYILPGNPARSGRPRNRAQPAQSIR
jgi:hypothetical protein